jgi:hypothetical protein
MALIVEDGTGVAGANSYGDVADARSYASDRGIALGTYVVVSQQLILATDYLESLSYVGVPVLNTQSLSWPRNQVQYDPDTPFPNNAIPIALVFAQFELVIAQAAGLVLQPSVSYASGGFVIEEKVDVISTRYSEHIGTTSQPILPKVRALLRTITIPTPALTVTRG